MPKCGAKTRGGGKCRREALAGKRRCALHGGKSTGPRNPHRNPGNRYAAKPGSLYSRFLTDEEKDIAASLELGSVDEELRLTRIRLLRALRREEEKGDEPELEERIEREVSDKVGARSEEKHKVRDYAGLIDRLTARIESLEARRALLIQQELDASLKRLDIQKREREIGDNVDDTPVTGITIRVVGHGTGA
jgi:hypothetical protein